jgi:hypothetical protein
MCSEAHHFHIPIAIVVAAMNYECIRGENTRTPRLALRMGQELSLLPSRIVNMTSYQSAPPRVAVR